jgi:hypothetical protein
MIVLGVVSGVGVLLTRWRSSEVGANVHLRRIYGRANIAPNPKTWRNLLLCEKLIIVWSEF